MDSQASPQSALAHAAWPTVPDGLTLLVPVGSTEQHGPHLPLDADTVIAVAVAEEAARRCGAATRVAPAIAYGSSGEHQAFPGTISVGTESLGATLVELGRSARTWAARVVFVNGHGGNIDALDRAVRLLRAEGTDAAWLPCRHGDGHAGRAETSLLLHLAPQCVAIERAEPGDATPVARLLPRLRTEGVRAVTPNGVLGDPTGASAREGSAILDRMVADVVAALAVPAAEAGG